MRFSLTTLSLVLLAVSTATAQVVLVKPQTTANFVAPDNPAKQIDAWTANLLILMREAGIDPVVENESFLTSNTLPSTIILFHAEYLSDEQVKALQEHLNQGNNLWITSGTGYRTATGEVRGWGFLQEVLGGTIEPTTLQSGTAVSLQMRYGRPGSSSLPPGYRWRLALSETPLSLKTTNSDDIVGYWARDAYQLEPADSIPRQAGFISRTTLSGGRVVWIGAGMEGLHLDLVNRDMSLKVLTETLGWLKGEGIPSVEAWPSAQKSAVLIHGDIEDRFEYIPRLTTIFKGQDVPVTYNILTSEAAKFPKALDEILKTRAELSVHGDDHSDFAGQPVQTQIDRLMSCASFIALYGPRPTAFRPTSLSYDDNTLRAAKNVGYTSVLAYNKPDRDYPIYNVDERSLESGLVFYPKSELDDYDLVEKIPIPTEAGKARNFIGDFNRINDLHGLYKLNFHSQYLATEELPKAVEKTLIEIKSRNDVWITDTQSISAWLKLRSRLLLQTNSNQSVVNLTLTNTSSAPARNVILRILPPQNVPAELLVPRNVSESIQYDVRDGVLYASIPNLKPGAIFKMELAAGTGPAMNLFNKNMLITGFKAFAAIGAIFILWFVMYLAFSGKKARPGRSQRTLPDLTTEEEILYRKLGIKNSDLDSTQTNISNGDSGSQRIDLVHNMPIASAPAGNFPMIPDPNQIKSVANRNQNTSRAVPSIIGTITGTGDFNAPTLSSNAVGTHPNGFSRFNRNSKVPALPMVFKPLTSTGDKPVSLQPRRKVAPPQLEMSPIPISEQIQADNPQQLSVSTNSISEAAPPQKAPAPRPKPESLLPVVGIPPQRPVSNALNPAQKSAASSPNRPMDNRNSNTFQSPSGLRTTANLPKPKRQGNVDNAPSNSSQSQSQGQPQSTPDPQGMVRTSVEMFRKQKAKSNNVEEWR